MNLDTLRLMHTVGSLRKSSGGPSQTVAALCRELGRLGASVELLSRDGGISGDDLNIPPRQWVTTTFTRPRRIPADLAGAFGSAVRDRCSAQQVQLIHDHGLWLPSNHASASSARRLGLPLIVSPRGMLEPWALAHRRWKKRLVWHLYQHRNLRSAAILHATAQQEADNFRRLGLSQPIALIPNGVELEGILETPGLSRGRQMASGVEASRRTALFLSRIHPKKGLLELVDAWSQVRPAGWRMVIAGPDEDGHRAVVEARAAARGLLDLFEFVGAVHGAEKTALYQSADLFVLPTFSENFGVVVAEALSCGVPVITTKGAPWQILQTLDCGWWVDTGSDALAAALCEATRTGSEVLRGLGERGRRYARTAFSWPEIAREMLRVYQWILGQEEQPECVQLD